MASRPARTAPGPLWRWAFALCSLLLASVAGHALAGSDEELDLLRVVARITPSDQRPETEHFVVTAATFGPRPRRIAADEPPLALVEGVVSADCTRVVTATDTRDAAPLTTRATAVLLQRGGNCSFVHKVLAAQHAGAALVVVMDTIPGAATSARATGLPIFDCALGQSTVAANASDEAQYPIVAGSQSTHDCTSTRACVTDTCVYTGRAGPRGTGYEICCFQNTLVRMGSEAAASAMATRVAIPAVFMSYRDAQILQEVLKVGPVSVSAFNAEENPWNISMFLTWLLGVVVVVGGAYCSSTEERRFSYDKVAMASMQLGGYMSIDDDCERTRMARVPVGLPVSHVASNEDYGDEEREEKLELTLKHAAYFVVGASSMLLMLYYGHLALVMNVLFMVSTTAAMAQIVILPVLQSVVCARANPHRMTLSVLALLISAGISIYWFVNRASPFIWPLQDLLCVSLCFVVIDSIQVPNLKVATTLLTVAFLYDVFFVYVSPLIFGSSVMVDVASGGANVRLRSDNYCQSHPTAAECHHERIPMVLSIPLLFSYYGGNALLGLGDLILPGLLVSFCIRYDYCMGYPLSRKYFCLSGVAYATGLLAANVMAVALRNIIAGQPALMYIVPIMLGSILGRAYTDGELTSMWDGPPCLRMRSDELDPPPRREEIEPFLKQQ